MSATYFRGTRLSAREQEVIMLVTAGNSTRQIAEMLAISPFTVSNHRKRILKKKGISTLREQPSPRAA